MKIKFDVSSQELAIIQQVLQRALSAQCTVWVFGSRAKHQAKHNSDLDLAIECAQALDKTTIRQLETEFDESCLPYCVDVVDMHKVEPYFKEIIDRQKVEFPFKANVPELRFKEFSNAWEESTLVQVVDFIDSLHETPKQYVAEGYPMIRVADVKDSGLDINTCLKVTKNIYEHFVKRYKPSVGDIVFSRVGTCGESILIDFVDKVCLGQNIVLLKSNENYKFIFFYLKTIHIKNQVNKKVVGSSHKTLSLKDLKKFSLGIPDEREQQKIAAFLSSVDDKLSKLRRKRELLETFKRGLMQIIFSQQHRFTQDDGTAFPDWEEKRLKELGEFRGGGTPATDKVEYWDGDIPWVSSSDISESSIHKISITRFINQKAIKESATKVIPRKSILIVSRVGVGKFAVSLAEVCTSQDFSNFTPAKDNIYFLAYLLMINKNKLLSFSQGTSIKGFTNDDIGLLRISIPCLEEQQKIADFLSAIDQKIDAVSQQITQTETFKKGLLQKLFV